MKEKSNLVLELGERFIALGLLRQWKGNLEELATVQDDLKLLVLTAEEKTDYKVAEKIDGNNNSSIQWRPDAPTKEFNLSKVSRDFLTAKIKELSDKKQIGVGDGPLVSLYGKLS